MSDLSVGGPVVVAPPVGSVRWRSDWNARLRNSEPEAIVRWALQLGEGRVVVSTNFRPYEAVLLDLVTRASSGGRVPVIWVDHGFNRSATYRHAEELRGRLGLDVRVYTPEMTAARWEALRGRVPGPEDEEALREFGKAVKVEPFARAMRELAPAVWLTSLRRVQNPHRAGLDIVSPDPNFGTLKVSPVFWWDDAGMESYLRVHGLPNEWDYHDPAKADERRECGLHVPLCGVGGGGAALQ